MEAPLQAAAADPRRKLLLLGTASLCIYGTVLWLSFAFREENPPLLGVLGLLGAATVLWWLALTAMSAKPQAAQLPVILGFAVAFRLLLLPSWPIQEIDFYRYLWDGRVTLHGGNPYAYSPFQIEMADGTSPATLAELAELSRQSASVQTIFGRVHFRDVPTAYPPLAQWTFAAAALVTPAEAPVYVHILLWKILLVGFDLATLAALVLLLRRLELPMAWCLAYAWCPLTLKEFANSGHFDAVAVFFTIVTLLALVEALKATPGRKPLGWGALAGVALGLGILAKTYPVVLLPVVAGFLISRLRWQALAPAGVLAAVLAVGYLPFLSGHEPAGDDISEPHRAGAGLGTFLSQWEMNDFLFMLVKENVREPRGEETTRWFVLVPASVRASLHRDVVLPCAASLDLSPKSDRALLLTQFLMGGVLLILTLRWAWQVYRRPEGVGLARAYFLTLAWGWLLSAAQNPWYLMWCLPFMVFAGRRSWFLLPGLVLLYYARFWVERHDTTGTLDVFDYGIVWLEYMPFFLALALESWSQGAGARRQESGVGSQKPDAVDFSPASCPLPPVSCHLTPDSSLLTRGPRRGATLPAILVTLLAVAAGLGLSLLLLHWTRQRVAVEGAGGLPRVGLEQVDHTEWDVLLQSYVDKEGMVAYKQWKANDLDVRLLDRYLARLGAVDLGAPASREAKLAFWINAYNALTVKGILREYPTSSIRNHTSMVGYNIWKDLLLEVDGRQYSLDDIEHAVVRPMGEPMIHFALVCASKGCPPLRNRVYSPESLAEELADNARRFFVRPNNFRVDAAARTVHISELLDWYGKDFAATPVEQIRALRPHFPATEDLSWIDQGTVTVNYLDYDWSLNDQEK